MRIQLENKYFDSDKRILSNWNFRFIELKTSILIMVKEYYYIKILD
jgi:hypothetical protein